MSRSIRFGTTSSRFLRAFPMTGSAGEVDGYNPLLELQHGATLAVKLGFVIHA